MAPENCSHCWSIGPLAVSAARSWSRQSFWFEEAAQPSSTIERRVAAGPVGDRRLDVDLDRETVGHLDRLGRARCATNRWKPRPRRCRSSSVGREAGEQHRASTGRRGRPGRRRRGGRRGGARCTGSRAARPSPCSSGDSWSLRGKTNHEPKNAGHEPRIADDRGLGASRSGCRRDRSRWRARSALHGGRRISDHGRRCSQAGTPDRSGPGRGDVSSGQATGGSVYI